MIRDDDVGCKKVGKYIRVNTNAENESKNEEDEDQTEEFGEANEKCIHYNFEKCFQIKK